MKKIFPILPPVEIADYGSAKLKFPFEDMKKIAAMEKIPIEKSRYKREIFYFKEKGIKEEGWTDTSEVFYAERNKAIAEQQAKEAIDNAVVSGLKLKWYQRLWNFIIKLFKQK